MVKFLKKIPGFIKQIFIGETNYWRYLNRECYHKHITNKLHTVGKVFVPKDVIRNSEIFNGGYIYEIELIDGYMEITAHKKIDLEALIPDNIVEMPRVLY